MIYFIPSWYQPNTWNESEQNWYMRRAKSEFDDTVKQIQLFHRSGAYEYCILLLSFAPNFRHFLHRQGVYRAPYWSCFDAIQEVKSKKARLLSVHNLNWPEGVEFVYSPFVMVAMQNGEKYAQVEFGEDGNPIQIDLFRDGKMYRRNYYDDRGFVSSTVVYNGGEAAYRDYLTENGIWKLRHFLRDGHVEVNPSYPEYLLMTGEKNKKVRFSKQIYHNMDEVIREVFGVFVRFTTPEAIFCAAVHAQHSRILLDVLAERKLILSIYENRYKIAENEEAMQLLGAADYIVTDSPETTWQLKSQAQCRLDQVMDISPYDTRTDESMSQHLNVQQILVPIDGIEGQDFADLVGQLAKYLRKNENAQICFLTRQAQYDRAGKLLKQTQDALRLSGFPEAWAFDETQIAIAENDLDEEEETPVRFLVNQCVDELSISTCMKTKWVLVDLREVPELYLQVLAVGLGIPQIVYRQTQFIEPGKNGILLQTIEQIPSALHYYLNGLKNRNKARINAYELSKKYTAGVLLQKWKEVIESVE